MCSFLKFLLTHENLYNAMDQKIFQNSMKISAEASCNFARWTCIIFVDFSVVGEMTKLVTIPIKLELFMDRILMLKEFFLSKVILIIAVTPIFCFPEYSHQLMELRRPGVNV